MSGAGTPDFFYREAQRLGYAARSAFKVPSFLLFPISLCAVWLHGIFREWKENRMWKSLSLLGTWEKRRKGLHLNFSSAATWFTILEKGRPCRHCSYLVQFFFFHTFLKSTRGLWIVRYSLFILYPFCLYCKQLLQMQKQYKLIKPGSSVLDLGCAPGAWLQVQSYFSSFPFIKPAWSYVIAFMVL